MPFPGGIPLLAVRARGMAQMGLMAFLPVFPVDYGDFGTMAAEFGIMSFSGTVGRATVPFLIIHDLMQHSPFTSNGNRV